MMSAPNSKQRFMPVENAQEAIGIARSAISQAGYSISRILSAEFDEEEEIWTVKAVSGQIGIELTIGEDGGIEDFRTNE